jgi:hypothetical protein
MQKKLCGLVVSVAAVTALVVLPVATASAQVDVVATTAKPVEVTPTTAFLTGIVATYGAPAIYQFQYGTTADYGLATKTVSIPASDSNFGIAWYPVTGLKPNTTYHYRLDAYATPGTLGYGYGYYGGSGDGADISFTTPSAGSMTLSSTTLGVAKGKASFSLKCSSTIACAGSYTASAKGTYKGKKKTYVCFSGSYALKAGAKGKFSPKLSAACAAFVSGAKKHKLGGVTFTATSSSGQAKLSKKITLKG